MRINSSKENLADGGENNNKNSYHREFFETFRKFMEEHGDSRHPYKIVVQMYYKTRPVLIEWGITENPNPKDSKGNMQPQFIMKTKNTVKVPRDGASAVARNNQEVKKTPEAFLVDAIIKDDRAVAESLLKKGAKPWAIVNDEPLIKFAERLGRKEIAELLEKWMMRGS